MSKSWLERAREIADAVSLARMDYLTDLGKKHLPQGFWGDIAPSQAGDRSLCLTFDDGPDPHTTPWLLEVLDEEDVKATFFLQGSQVARHEHLVEKIKAAGHSIGNHTFNHLPLPLLPTPVLESEVDNTSRWIAGVTGEEPRILRPPYGVIDKRGADCLRERNIKTVYWGVVPEDWWGPGTTSVVRRVLKRLDRGRIIVLHEQRALARQTIKAAKEIICKSKDMGYHFVDLPLLMTTQD